MRQLYYLLAIFCFLSTACSNRIASRSGRLQFEPHLVSKPADMEEVYQELGFTYLTIEEAERKIVAKLDSLYATDDGFYIYRMHNDELRTLVQNDPASFTYDFPLMQEKEYVSISTSDDGNLRLYHWNTGEGGTMIDWGNLCQFRSNGEIYVYECGVTEIEYTEDDEFTMGCAVLGLYTVQSDKGETYYLAHTYVREMSNLGFAEISPVKIEKNRLVPVWLFEEEADEWGWNPTTREYSIADWYFRTNLGEGWDWIYRYDADTRTLYIPKQRDMEMTDQYNLYTFNGEKFVYVRDDGGYWLHPSIRNFEYLEDLFCTKDYRVRIDQMSDGSYRYVSWKKDASMDSQPDIIIYDGSFNEEDEIFSFENDGYNYKIFTSVNESTLSVYCDDKRILFQKQVAKY